MDYVDKLDLNNPTIKSIISSIKYDKKRLVIFAGAGVSALCGLPLWNDFAKQLVNDCYNDGLINFHNKNVFIKNVGNNSKLLISLIYDIYESNKRLDDFYDHFKSNLLINDDKKNEKLIKSLKKMKSSIITTNADEILDKCCASKNNIYFIQEINEISNCITNPFVIHLHGSVTKKETLVFTVKQYLNQYQYNDAFYDKMNFILNNVNSILLFIGTSMSELELLQYMINKNSSKYILNGFYNNETAIEKALAYHYKECFNIKQISFSMDQYGYQNIINFLDDFSNTICATTNVSIEIYDKIIESIKNDSAKIIAEKIDYSIDAFEIGLLANIFNEVNQSKQVLSIYIELYKLDPNLFDIYKYDYNKTTTQNIIITNLSYCKNITNEPVFKKFINEYINYFEKALNSNKSLIESYQLILCYLNINLNLKNNNEKKIVKLFELLAKNNVSYLFDLIYSIIDCTLSSNTVYKIIKLLFEKLSDNEYKKYIVQLDMLLEKNIEKLLSNNSIKFFRFIKRLINFEINNNQFAYGDMGAIYDYANEKKFITYDEYLIKVIKNIIDNLLPADVEKVYKICSNKTIDKKIKIYIIDKHFELIKDKINDESFDSTDCVASLGWIINNHRDYIINDKEYKDKLNLIVDNYTFKSENENDAKGLRHILSSLIDGIDYRNIVKYNSKYEYYEFYDIGKLFWIDSNVSNYHIEYNEIENLNLCDTIQYINNNFSKFFDAHNAIKKYFRSKEIVEEMLSSPDLFKSIKHDNFYYDILYTICDKNDIDSQLIKDFLKSIVSEKCSERNAWIWLRIIEANCLLKDIAFSDVILNSIFNKLITYNYEFDAYNKDLVSITINNVLYDCVNMLCDLHINLKDIIIFVNNILINYANDKNYLLILSSIANKYEIIYEEDKNIKDIILKIIKKNNEKELICIYNNLINISYLSTQSILQCDEFIKVMPKLDQQICDYLCNIILINYNGKDKRIFKAITNNENYDLSWLTITNLSRNKNTKLDYKLYIIDLLVKKNKIDSKTFNELLSLMLDNLDNGKLEIICINVVNQGFSYFNCDDIDNSLIKLLNIKEDYVIQQLFKPIFDFYIEKHEYYIEDKFYELFDNIFEHANNSNNIEVLKELARKAFGKGLIKFEKYLHD